MLFTKVKLVQDELQVSLILVHCSVYFRFQLFLASDELLCRETV